MPYNENKRKYNMDYIKEHIKRVPLDMQISDYEKLKQTAVENGFTVNGFIKAAINEKIERLDVTGNDTE